MRALALTVLAFALGCSSGPGNGSGGGAAAGTGGSAGASGGGATGGMGNGGGASGGASGGAAGGSAGAAGGSTGGGSGGSGGNAGGSGGAGGGRDPLITARPYQMTVPAAYDGGIDVPLVVLLHGYGANAATQDTYFGLSTLARQRNFLVALPNGTLNAGGQRFWNATDACCAANQTVDDVAYLTAVVNDVKAQYRVDPKRVYFVGHSNGGFMSHRMACDRSSMIAAIVSLAGAQWLDASRCAPSAPVAALQVHGTLDSTILYDGGAIGLNAYPGAKATVGTWSAKNGCSGITLTSAGADVDLVTALLGDETLRERYGGCPGGAAELWTIRGAGHIPGFNDQWAAAIYDWLQAHPKP